MDNVSQEEYAKAVAACVDLAQQPTGGGRVAAQVLLSAYNGDSFQLDVTDLCNLDRSNYENAITVIRGRYEIRREPQEMIADGGTIFRALWNQWARLELSERAKVRCPNCNGGRIYENSDDETGVVCPICAGTGKVCGCK